VWIYHSASVAVSHALLRIEFLDVTVAILEAVSKSNDYIASQDAQQVNQAWIKLRDEMYAMKSTTIKFVFVIYAIGQVLQGVFDCRLQAAAANLTRRWKQGSFWHWQSRRMGYRLSCDREFGGAKVQVLQLVCESRRS
jgi:hypothetical protein